MAKARIKLAPFDAAEYLDSEEMIAEYLTAALESSDPDLIVMAIANVAKARGIANVARDTGLGRESLYKALAPGSKVRFETILKLVDSLGVRLAALPR